MKFEFSTRSKLLLLIGAPATLLLGYWLLKDKDDDDEEEEAKENMATSRQTIIDIKVPPKAVGAVIGRQGAMIKEIQQLSGARVNFKDDNRDTQEDRTVVIRGKPEAAQLAENMIRKIITELPVMVTEEMAVPGKCLGRIIGRNGDTIRQISRISRAKCYVDRTKDDYRDTERTVTITGTKEQIELAREMIKEKVDEEEVFRAKKAVMEANREQRQKPKHTGHRQERTENTGHCQERTDNTGQPQQHQENINHSSGDTNQQNGATDSSSNYSVHPAIRDWPAGRDYIEVYVSAVANPGLFWVQALSSMSVELDNLVDRITSVYASEISNDCIITTPVVGDIVAAPFENDPSWYRAKVMGVEGDTVDLLYVDYGDSSYLTSNKIRRLRSEFESLPFQAIECHLAHIKPVGDTWSDDATEVFDEMTYAAKWKVLMAKKVGHHKTSTGTIPVLELVDTNSEQDLNIAQEMVKRGYAVWDETDVFG